MLTQPPPNEAALESGPDATEHHLPSSNFWSVTAAASFQAPREHSPKDNPDLGRSSSQH
jgi:hypothetical protein